jgi:hypothetical protein
MQEKDDREEDGEGQRVENHGVRLPLCRAVKCGPVHRVPLLLGDTEATVGRVTPTHWGVACGLRDARCEVGGVFAAL